MALARHSAKSFAGSAGNGRLIKSPNALSVAAFYRGTEPRQRLAQILVCDLRQIGRDLRGGSGVASRRRFSSRPPKRRLAQRHPPDRPPAEEAVDAFADHVGEVLNFDRCRAFDPQHERSGLSFLAFHRTHPLDLDRLAVGGNVRSRNFAPARHQLRRSKALPGKRLAHDLADKVAEWLGVGTDGLVHDGAVCHPSAGILAMTVAANRAGRQRADRCGADCLPQPAALLAWYDRHRRKLPWRAKPDEHADPYRVWLSEIMLQQTTVKAVGPYYARFLTRWPDVHALAAAPLDEVLKTWAGLGYYARARNLHACARAVVDRHGGEFPPSEAALRALPGIGDYTAAAIAAIAFDQCSSPVDGNIERVIARLFAVALPLPAAKPQIRRLAQSLTPQHRSGDFAQAMMDLGATICTPKKPACALCPWNDVCSARARGEAEIYPHRMPKREGVLRRGAAFVARRADGYILVRTRPPKGLLGGMTEVPTTEWTQDFDEATALPQAPRFSLASSKPKAKTVWRRTAGVVRHVFTHFPLELSVYAAELPAETPAPAGLRWTPLAELAGEALPNVMRKVVTHAIPGY